MCAHLSAALNQENDPRYLYGSAFNDHYLLCDPATLPRYGHLARKAMMRYAGDLYNPHIHGITHEVFLRRMIKEFIAYKVLYKTAAYDWEWIDHSLRKYFSGCFEIDLPYDQKRIDAGLKDGAKAPLLIEWVNVN